MSERMEKPGMIAHEIRALARTGWKPEEIAEQMGLPLEEVEAEMGGAPRRPEGMTPEEDPCGEAICEECPIGGCFGEEEEPPDPPTCPHGVTRDQECRFCISKAEKADHEGRKP